jgi:2-(1,2-epoxy-1,2-dihydrophenyl)acetyl-CoA isomerase
MSNFRYSQYSAIGVDFPATDVIRILINRPAKRNAIDQSVRDELQDVLAQINSAPPARAMVLGGVGGNLSAGGDLPTMLDLDRAAATARMQQGHAICRSLHSLEIPVVTAVEGVGVGAAIGLALLGDQLVMGERARILFPFLNLGLTPDWGLMFTLPRRVGTPTAWRLLVQSENVSAEDALRIGLVDILEKDERVMQTSVATASKLARLPATALNMMRKRFSLKSSTLEEELKREESDQVACLLSDEFGERSKAFLSKARPQPTIARK